MLGSTYMVLTRIVGPWNVTSHVARIFDVKYLTSTLGSPLLLVSCLAIPLLGCDVYARDRSNRIAEVLDSHPVKNRNFVIGRALGVYFLSLGLLAVCLAIVLVGQHLTHHFFMGFGVSSISSALWYLFVNAAPVLFLWTAVVVGLAAVIKTRTLVALIGLVLVIAHWSFVESLPLSESGFFGTQGPIVPSIPSELLTHSGIWGVLQDNGETIVHRLGVMVIACGLLSAASGVWLRRDQSNKVFKWTSVVLLFSLGVGMVWMLIHRDAMLRDERVEWANTHKLHMSSPTADLKKVSGKMRIDPGNSVELSVLMEVTVEEISPLDELVFSFNPGMSIESLTVGEHTADYSFDDGLLVISMDSPQTDANSLYVNIQARGKPDHRFAYLDESKDLWEDPKASGLPLIALGRNSIVFHESYVALMPAAMWLPLPGSNYGRGDIEKRQTEFFEIDLVVEVPVGWTIVAPDRQEEDKVMEWVSYRVAPSVPVPNFALLAAEFEVNSTTIDEYEIELLMHKNHASALDWVEGTSTGLPQLIEPVLKRISDAGWSYPYRRFSLVEIPSSLRTYSGNWPLESVASSPGALMIREWGLAKAPFQDFLRRYSHFQPEQDNDLLALYYIQAFLQTDTFGGGLDVELAYQFTSFRTLPTGEGARAVEQVVRRLARVYLSGTGMYMNWMPNDGFTALTIDEQRIINKLVGRRIENLQTDYQDMMVYMGDRYFDGRTSGWDAVEQTFADITQLRDPTLRRNVFVMKASTLKTMLFQSLGSEGTGKLLAKLLATYEGQSYLLEDFDEIARELELDAVGALDSWVLNPGLPGFTVEEAVVREQVNSDGELEYLTTVSVRNNESMPGVVSTSPSSTYSSGDYIMIYSVAEKQSKLVPAHSLVVFSHSTETPPESITVQPYLSRNRSQWTVPVEAKSNDELIADREENGSHTNHESGAGEVRVLLDDLDDAFSVINAPVEQAGLRFVNFLRPGFLTEPDFDQGIPRYDVLSTDPQIWSRIQMTGAYGKYRRTTTVGLSTATEGVATFESVIPEKGDWKLSYHLPVSPGTARAFESSYTRYVSSTAARARPLGKQGDYDIRVLQGERKKVIPFDASYGKLGWNDLGTLDLDVGPLSVQVSNETNGTFVYADAVRLTLLQPN